MLVLVFDGKLVTGRTDTMRKKTKKRKKEKKKRRRAEKGQKYSVAQVRNETSR
jgi:hypothetical protein